MTSQATTDDPAAPRPPDASRDLAIAVIGIAVRFPGARDPFALWRNLAAGIESITIGQAPRNHVVAAGVLDDVEAFDARFFHYTRPEAEQMDPQHRVFLEAAWSALESAGHAPRGAAIRAGVYAGCSINTYLLSNVLPRAADRGISAVELILGSVGDFLATRVAYKLNLTGPAMTVQAGCSTSLVAVHLACQALLSGECDLALAGGASIRVPQLAPQRVQDGGVLAPDGHCRAFDARAAGTVTAHGCGVVVLKRLADAIADRDPIRAVVLGTAINNDGSAKTGFAAPSVTGQAAVITEALAMAGVEPRTISYVEAHGTATPLGDPIEVAALRRVFAGAPPGSCGLGSVKTNLGHLDAASGIAGFIKTVLALEHRHLPASLHFTTPNPGLAIDGSPFYVVAAAEPWRGPVPLRAGVSAYGMGGTNAHAVLEQAPVVDADPPRRTSELIVVSAKTPAALDRIAAELAEHLAGCADPLADVAHTLQVGRARFGCRRFVVASDTAAAAASLARGDDQRRTELDLVDRRTAAFVFPGSGVQRVNMGAELAAEAGFRDAIDGCAELLRPALGGDLREVMFAGPERFDAMAAELDRPLWSQLAIFVCDWAIAQQWLAWGVRPEAVLGHSLGEYVAACLAGVFTLEDALALVVARARLFEALPVGGMVSVLAPASDVAPLVAGELSVAAINGPSTCVVSGPLGPLAAFEAALVSRGVQHRRLRFQRATHSAMLDPHLPGFARAVARITLRPPVLPVVSCVTGTWLDANDATDPAYWCRHLRHTVQFSDAVACLVSGGPRAVIEAGPGTTLTALVRQHPASTAGAAGASHRVIATLPPASGRPVPAVTALGEAWLAGVDVDWVRFRAGERRRRVALPTYSFERDRYWIDEAPAAAPAGAWQPGAEAPPPPSRGNAGGPGTPHGEPPDEARREPPDEARSAPRAERRDERHDERRDEPRDEPRDAPRSEIERALVACFHDVFGPGHIGLDDDFFALGGDSLLGLRLTAQIDRRLGHGLALKDLLEAPTVRALAERIAPEGSAPAGRGSATRAPVDPSGSLVVLKPGSESGPGAGAGSGGAPVFFLHAVGGHVVFYRELARIIAPARAAYGLEAVGLEDAGRCHRTVEDMAACYLERIRSVQPRGPYLLVGASFGGVLAYELGRRLSLEGEAVPLCALLDSPGPGYLPPAFADDAESVAELVSDWCAVSPDRLRGLPVTGQLQLVLDEAARTGARSSFASVDQGLQLLAVWRANFAALHGYAAPAWPRGEFQFFRAAERGPRQPDHPELAWIGRCERVTVEVVPGGHASMLAAPHVERLGARITTYLERA